MAFQQELWLRSSELHISHLFIIEKVKGPTTNGVFYHTPAIIYNKCER